MCIRDRSLRGSGAGAGRAVFQSEDRCGGSWYRRPRADRAEAVRGRSARVDGREGAAMKGVRVTEYHRLGGRGKPRQTARNRPAAPDRREPAKRLRAGSGGAGARIVVGACAQSRDFPGELRIGGTSGRAGMQTDFRQGHLCLSLIHI